MRDPGRPARRASAVGALPDDGQHPARGPAAGSFQRADGGIVVETDDRQPVRGGQLLAALP